ncbi:hypothetical protein IMG5_021070 [Ichthyophthirius multifiliis]|uniref:Cysteine protease n=1 Tax=Ichthyophthirius multifiliis TaxID=5932 RepID=G0QKS0_ICHMU|nr:hypothetical protein IMG5_021070 [Ichthyophthirius multifiliis]EGR34192.1 hypothetical protein IMG5_021070 [Ichthyophthirius multifiliis]|eukprot:XP_004039496.1 hypothetical protein IMG5_021070 [Ichthyophthirius multifiliis]
MFESIIWITYRRKFPPLKAPQYEYISDTGWGCMIRVGQMALAEGLKRFQIKEDEIIDLFQDKKDSLFSIQNICEAGKEEFKLEAGDWFNPIRICYILQILNEKKGFKDLKIRTISSDRILIFEDLEMEFSSEKNGLILFLVCKLGLEKTEENYLKIALKIFDYKNSIGMIGGKPKKALFFVGRIEDQLIYLDPHYVQDFNQNNVDQNSYFCKNYAVLDQKKIDSSIGNVLFFENKEELKMFFQFLDQLKEEFVQDFFLAVEKVKPDYLKQVEYENELYSSDFEVL